MSDHCKGKANALLTYLVTYHYPMAAGNTQAVKEQVLDERVSSSPDLEPLFDPEISVVSAGSNGDGSLRHTIPEEAVSLLDLTTDDDVIVEIYQDGYWVEPANDS